MAESEAEAADAAAAAAAAAEADIVIYHERQRLQLCLLHALNNLFQHKDAFTRPHLDALARRLASSSPSSSSHLFFFFTPHHNSLTGNYDVNVLMAALQDHSKTLRWHDRRSPASSIDLAAPHLLGLLLNTAVRRLRGLWSSRHWLALRSIGGRWYNLDSDLCAPEPFPDEQHLVSFLDSALAQGAEIFVVFNNLRSHDLIH